MRRRMMSSIGCAKKPTARDYVHDGLVAMWDGIENAGWGTHDANATVWKDLVGTKDLTVTLTGCEWGDDGLICQSVTGYKAYASIGVSSIATIDISLKINKIAFAYPFYIGLSYNGVGDNGVRYTGAVSRSLILNANGNCIHGQGAYAYKYSIGDHTLSAIFSGDLLPAHSAYDNAQEQIKNEAALITAGGTGNYTAIGSRGGGSAPFDGVIRCVRAYNRALTADEIAHNYAIDKERFGIS